MEEVIEKLKEIGLNEYQSKVYLALLKKYPSTGYEVSKLANIPQSRTYDTLKSLENLHIVYSSNTKPVSYTPIKPKELTKNYKRKIDSTIHFLEKKLPSIREDVYVEPILSINGRVKILDKITEIINNAQKSIFIAIWGQDFKHIEHLLWDAYDRGLDVKILKYDNFTCNFGRSFQHIGINMFDMSGKYLFLTADESEGFFGKTDASGIWTKNPEIVFLIKSFSVYNMYLLDIQDNFPEQLRYFYGTGLKKLHDKVLR